jgi:hypothetical protein
MAAGAEMSNAQGSGSAASCRNDAASCHPPLQHLLHGSHVHIYLNAHVPLSLLLLLLLLLQMGASC